ncbi:MAG: ATP--guanido phosphotransferase [Clostridia bacterium]
MWFRQVSKDSDVVVSSRVRFARNLEGYKFPHMNNSKESEEIILKIEEAIKNLEGYKLFKMKDIDRITTYSLVEQHLISKEFIEGLTTALVLSEDNSLVMMINEEDHLRIQAFESGFNLDLAYSKLCDFTDKLEQNIKFSENEKYGYLTASPNNIGSGMRVSVMLHLPALKKIGILSKIFEQATSIGISVRGIYGENTSSIGSMYQISNRKTLGVSDEDILSSVKLVVTTLIEQERKARQLLKKKSLEFEDEIYRAYGIIKNARIISDEEALRLLSKVRLGVSLDMIKDTTLQKIQSLIIDTQTNTLKSVLKTDFMKEEENIKRGEYIRKELK